MIIAVIGNISSGKSTTCKALENHLKGYEYISLDSYRRDHIKKWRSRSVARTMIEKIEIEKEQLDLENKAKDLFYFKVQSTPNVIIEATGTGKDFARCFAGRSDEDILVIKLKCSIDECIKRTKDKIKNGYVWPPLPEVYKDYSGLTDAPLINVLQNSIIWMNSQLNKDYLTPCDLSLDSKIHSTEDIVKAISLMVR